MKRIVFSIPGNETLAQSLALKTDSDMGVSEIRHFPDGETYIRLVSAVRGREVLIACTLDRPDEKTLLLYFMARALRERGAAKITLVAPYLAYMRQDTAFRTGELVTSVYFAELVSRFVDELVTVDPHLHRRRTMAEIYSVPCKVLHAARAVSAYIRTNIPNAVLIGPDTESQQWVAHVAKEVGAPFVVLAKERKGDREVKITLPPMEEYRGYTPVILDDIVSTARTMIETTGQLIKAGFKAPVCIGVHPIFADSSYDELKQAGAKEIISCNTIAHVSNKIDLTDLLAENLK